MCKNDPDIIIKHLGLSDRIAIEQGLYQGKTFKDIALEIGKDPSTVAKEVKRFLAWDNGIHARIKGIDCVHIDSCREEMLCFLECSGYCKNNCDCTRYCPKYEAVICPQLRSAPYVCNPCMEKNSCLLSKYYYSADMADRRYKNLLVSSRAGINMAPEDLQRLNGLISPLIRNGQPLSHIFSVHKGDIPCSRTTVYNYLIRACSMCEISICRAGCAIRSGKKTVLRTLSFMTIGDTVLIRISKLILLLIPTMKSWKWIR